MRLAITSFITLSIVAAITYFHGAPEQKRIEIPVIPVVAEAPASAPVAKPEPFAYAEAVIPSFVPTPKARPHHRHRRAVFCK